MACAHCEFKGYIDGFAYRDGGLKPIVTQCQRCRDTAAYSNEVERRAKLRDAVEKMIAESEIEQPLTGPPCPVIAFRPKGPK